MKRRTAGGSSDRDLTRALPEGECEIEEDYRRAHATEPQEDWVGEVGLALGADLIAASREEICSDAQRA